MPPHTPAPWSRIEGPRISNADGEAVCDLILNEYFDGNLSLIASAPDLLAERDRLQALNLDLLNALQSYVSHAEGWESLQPLSRDAQTRLDNARAAIRAFYSDEGK